MGVIALIVLMCVVGAITGMRLASQEAVDAEGWGLIGLWAVMAVGVVLLMVRRGRVEQRKAGPGGDG